MKRIYLNKETRKIIEQAIPRKVRRDYKDGRAIMVIIKRSKPLKRWGNCLILVLSKNGEILDNTATANAWNYERKLAKIEAKDAVDYFVYGEKGYEWIIYAY